MEPKPTPATGSEPQNDSSNVPASTGQTPETAGNFQPVVIAPTVRGAGLTPISHDPEPAKSEPAASMSLTTPEPASPTTTVPAAADTKSPTTESVAQNETNVETTPTPAITPANLEPTQPSATPEPTAPAGPTSSEDPMAATVPAASTSAPAETPATATVAATDTTTATETPAATEAPTVSETPTSTETPATTEPTQPTQPTQPAQVFSSSFAPEEPPKKKGSKKKLFLFTGGGVLLALLLAGGFVFGYYLPNTPSHVWSTGLDRTGKALDTIVTSATEEKKLETYKTSEISGSFNATYAGQSYSGELTSAFDDTDSDSGLTVSTKDKAGKTTDLKILTKTNIAKGNNFPDIYLQIVGLKALGLDAYVPNISSYDSKWIQIDSKYLESIGATYLSGTDNNQKEITSSDIAELARTATNVTTDYLLTTNKDKAVFTQQSFVGKETVDGVKAYHYTVGIDKEHAKAYCTALSNALLSSNAYKKVAQPKDNELAKAKENATKECQTSVDESFKATDTFDLWIDSKYKLVYKVRVYDEKDKGIYTDVGQLYKGDDKLSLFAAWHDTKAKSDSKFTVDTDLKTNATTGTFSAKNDDKDYPYDLTATVKATLSNKDVKFTKPSPTVPIQDLLNALGYPASPTTSASATAKTTSTTTSSSAADTERKTDLSSIRAHIEAYYAQYGSYPSLTDLNNSAWRAKNVPSLQASALTDPKGSSPTLVATATATQYGYQPTCNASKTACDDYVLTATLSDGTIYTKKSLQ